jgi:hypothetical protein
LILRTVCSDVYVSEFKAILLKYRNYLFAANTLVQKFVYLLNMYQEKNQLLIPLPHLIELLTQLLNPSVTQLDLTLFRRISNANKILLLNHALKKCPKIGKIKLMEFNCYNYGELQILLPAEVFHKSWNNLKVVNCTADDYIAPAETLKFIQENMPNIE